MDKDAERPNGLTLVKEFLDDFLSLKKGVLYTIGGTCLKPWEVFHQYMSAEGKLISSPLKLLLTISPLLALFSYITPSEELMTHMNSDWEQVGFTGSHVDVVESISGDLEEEKKEEVESQLDEINKTLLNTMDEYPVAVFLINIVFLGLAIKSIFYKKITIFEATILSGYIIIPYTVINTIFVYLVVWVYGYENGFSLIIVGLQTIAVGLLFFYLYGVARKYYDYSKFSSFLRMIGTVVLMQLYAGVFGILLGITFKIITG